MMGKENHESERDRMVGKEEREEHSRVRGEVKRKVEDGEKGNK